MDELREFVQEILASKFKAPYSENIIDEVFCAIEDNLAWHKRYEDFCDQYDKHTVNPQIGKAVKDYTGLKTESYPNTPKSNLIKSYSKLTS
jgi:hypothetical protein